MTKRTKAPSTIAYEAAQRATGGACRAREYANEGKAGPAARAAARAAKAADQAEAAARDPRCRGESAAEWARVARRAAEYAAAQAARVA